MSSPATLAQTFTAPASWVSYLINGDASGLEESERVAADQWRVLLLPWEIVDLERDDEGEVIEPHYGRVPFDVAPFVDFRFGMMVDYVAVDMSGERRLPDQ